MTLRQAHTDYIKVTESKTHDFYVVKLRSGWYAFATQKGVHPAKSEGRTIASFTTKKSAVTACHAWAVTMK